MDVMAFSDSANTSNKTVCKIVKIEKEDTDRVGALFICFLHHSALTCTWCVDVMLLAAERKERNGKSETRKGDLNSKQGLMKTGWKE
jgi:hypothetical protein